MQGAGADELFSAQRGHAALRDLTPARLQKFNLTWQPIMQQHAGELPWGCRDSAEIRQSRCVKF